MNNENDKYLYIYIIFKMMITFKNTNGQWPNASNHHSSPKSTLNSSSLKLLDSSSRSSKAIPTNPIYATSSSTYVGSSSSTSHWALQKMKNENQELQVRLKSHGDFLRGITVESQQELHVKENILGKS